jgi:hypothetical protein
MNTIEPILIQLLAEATKEYQTNPCFRNHVRILYLLRLAINDKKNTISVNDLYLLIRDINDAGIGLIDVIPYNNQETIEDMEDFCVDGEKYEHRYAYDEILDLIQINPELSSFVEKKMLETLRGRYELVIYRIKKLYDEIEENTCYGQLESTECGRSINDKLLGLMLEFKNLCDHNSIPDNILEVLAIITVTYYNNRLICSIFRYLTVLSAKNIIRNNIKCSWKFFHAFVISQMFCEDHMILYKLLKCVDIDSHCFGESSEESLEYFDIYQYLGNGVYLNLCRLDRLNFPVSLNIEIRYDNVPYGICAVVSIKINKENRPNEQNCIKVNRHTRPYDINNCFYEPCTIRPIKSDHNCLLAYKLCIKENSIENGFKLSDYPLLPFRYLPIIAFITINCLFGIKKTDEINSEIGNSKLPVKFPFLPNEILFIIFGFL